MSRSFVMPRTLLVINSVVALWLALLANTSFLGKIAALTPYHDWRFEAFMAAMVVLLAAYINLFLTVVTWGRLARPVLTFILLASALTAYFVDTFGVGIDAGQIQNMMETDFQESWDLATWGMLAYVLVIAGLPLFWLWRKPLAPEGFLRRQRNRLFGIGGSLALVALVAAFYYADLASIFREHRPIRFTIVPHNYVTGLRAYFKQHQVINNEPLQKYGEDAQRLPSTGKPKLLVMIVGETARAESFGLQGYARNTTPELAKLPITYYSNVSSCGTATAVSLPCLFSGFTRKDYDAKVAKNREGLLDILKRSGYAVSWLDNNSGCKGACDRIERVPLLESRKEAWCVKGECRDDLLIESFAKHLADAPVQDRVIVLHQEGSHGPAYYLRYPKAFERFTPTCNSNALQSCTQQQVINTYDNTIAYTDHIIASAIKTLAQDPRYSSALLYVSDHGESTGERGLYLHGAPYLFAPSQQTHVPMLTWVSPNFGASEPARAACLSRRHADELSHDNVFHSMLGLAGVRTAVHNTELDMSTGCAGQ